jgi:hypothetical protein
MKCQKIQRNAGSGNSVIDNLDMGVNTYDNKTLIHNKWVLTHLKLSHETLIFIDRLN